jgi:hypothetical protein
MKPIEDHYEERDCSIKVISQSHSKGWAIPMLHQTAPPNIVFAPYPGWDDWQQLP